MDKPPKIEAVVPNPIAINPENPGPDFGKLLSNSEIRILNLLAENPERTNKEIANTPPFVTEGTVKQHLYIIFQKTGYRNRRDLVTAYKAFLERKKGSNTKVEQTSVASPQFTHPDTLISVEEPTSEKKKGVSIKHLVQLWKVKEDDLLDIFWERKDKDALFPKPTNPKLAEGWGTEDLLRQELPFEIVLEEAYKINNLIKDRIPLKWLTAEELERKHSGSLRKGFDVNYIKNKANEVRASHPFDFLPVGQTESVQEYYSEKVAEAIVYDFTFSSTPTDSGSWRTFWGKGD